MIRRIIDLIRRPGSRFSRLVSTGEGVAPTITVAPVLTWTVAHGSSPTITPPTYTGDPATITYDLIRLPSTTVLSGVDLATAQAYVADRSTDVGYQWIVTATATNGAGSDSEDSNAVEWYPDVLSGIVSLYDAETRVDVGGEVDEWTDLVGSNDLLAPTASQRPGVGASFAGSGKPFVDFDGVDNRLSCAAFAWGGTVSAAAFAAALGLPVATNGGVVVRYSVRPYWIQSTVFRISWSSFDSATLTTPVNGLNAQARSTTSWGAVSAAKAIELGGVAPTSPTTDGATSVSNNLAFHMGGNGNDTSFSQQDVAMFFVLDRSMTSGEHLDWEAYCAARWGLPT